MLKRLWANIPSRRRIQCSSLLFLTIAASIVEMMSIGAVVPFLGVLIEPSKIFTHPTAKPLINWLGVSQPEQLLIPLTVAFSAAALISGATRLLLLWAQTRIGHAIGAGFSIEIYRRTLYQPYAVHLARNSSEVIAGITMKTSVLVNNTVLPLLTLLSSSVMLIAILAVLIMIHPMVALGAFSGFALIYLIVISLTKRNLNRDGQRISDESTQVVKALQEGLGGIRDVLLDGTQAIYCQIFQRADLPMRRAQANVQIVSGSPRFVIEALAVTLIAWLSYWLSRASDGITTAIPVLGALAIGAQRLLPMLQQIYISLAAMRGGQASLRDALDLLEQPLPRDAHQPHPSPLPFTDKIALSALSYSYAEGAPMVLSNIDLIIPKGSRFGFIGTTGGGKSTLMDIIMGLLLPVEGCLLVDGVSVTAENRRAWQTRIAHVPQAIFLADATISENIAFGIHLSDINHERVKLVARRAQIAETIEALPNGYQTMTGESGVRLSGGQRQRIGIARALYKNADVIFLDEATSALDNQTERLIMETIDGLGKDYTVLMVAHRLSTLARCDRIVELEQGKISRIFSYSEINNIRAVPIS